MFGNRRKGSAALVAVLLSLLLLSACGPTVTPVVIRDNKRSLTLTAAAMPSPSPTGPTAVPTATSTPYVRATDTPDLDLSQPIVQVGSEVITLGDFRARVRYERFSSLEEVRRGVALIGLSSLNFTVPGKNPAADRVAAVFNTLANSQAFGVQVYEIMLREVILRHEYERRALTLNPSDVQAYWIRRFNLQREADPSAAVGAPLEVYLEEAVRYSGMSREAIMGIAESFVRAAALQPIIVREVSKEPRLETFNAKRILSRTQNDAETALAFLQEGGDFREAVCRYSIDPGAHGSRGDTGFTTRSGLNFAESASVIAAEIGAVVGPFSTSLGWQIFKISDKRRNPDGDAEIRAQAITVATETLAQQIVTRAKTGEDFSTLVCLYSLGKDAGDGGNLGSVGVDVLSPELARLINASAENGLFGPVQTANGYEIALIENRKVDIPNPEELDRAAEQTFIKWQLEQVQSGTVVQVSEVWRNAIPTDPLPIQVAPFLTEASFGLPTLVPTATP